MAKMTTAQQLALHKAAFERMDQVSKIERMKKVWAKMPKYISNQSSLSSVAFCKADFIEFDDMIRIDLLLWTDSGNLPEYMVMEKVIIKAEHLSLIEKLRTIAEEIPAHLHHLV